MTTWIDSILQSPLDLSAALLSEPGPSLFVITSKMTTARVFIAVLFGVLAIGFALHAWMHRASWWDILWPHLVVIPVFTVVSIVIGFGFHQKSFDVGRRLFLLSARMGPFSTSRSYPLPHDATIHLTFRRVYPSRGPGKTSGTTMPTRWYDIQIDSLPGATFTIASDRAAARDVANKMASALQWRILDEVENDGVDRSLSLDATK